LIGILPTVKAQAKYNLAMKTRRYRSAVNAYELNPAMIPHVWDITFRKNFNMDVVTFLGDDFAEELRERLDDEGLPLATVRSSKPDKLARSLAYDPSVYAVYDPDPSHIFLYGGKGRITDPNKPDFYGV
jgi:hypothetical protein